MAISPRPRMSSVLGRLRDGRCEPFSFHADVSVRVVLGETVKFEDLVKRNGLFYNKFTDVPFSGKVSGKRQGSIKNGK